MRVISWNLLRLTGATVEDVAKLVHRERPDLLLMQEATRQMESLPGMVGGHLQRVPLPGRIHGLAAWSPHQLPPTHTLELPVSRMPGRLPPRLALVLRLGDITFANVHLSHGQLLNRRQLARIAAALHGHPSAIIGDYNAVGPILLPGFRDVGPREPTHFASSLVPFRLDRCLVHGLHCLASRALDFGPSDHKPIVLELQVGAASRAAAPAAAPAAA